MSPAMRMVRAAISPLLAAWLVLLAGITPAHCLLRLAVVHDLCSPVAAFQQDSAPQAPTPDAAHAPCLVCASLPGITPPEPSVLAAPILRAAPPAAPAASVLPAPGRIAQLPPARGPPATA